MKIVFRCPPELAPVLPRPIPAKAGLPDWLRTMPAVAHAPELGIDLMTLKRCAPFLDAMSFGYLMPLPCDVTVSAGRLSWNWDLPPTPGCAFSRSPVALHAPAQVSGTPFANGARPVVKFNAFWTVELEPGWSLLCLHPLNRADLPFRAMAGLVDSDRYTQNFINFVVDWVDPDFEGTLARNTPIAQIVPIRREAHEAVFETLSGDSAAAFQTLRDSMDGTPGVYRRGHRVRKG